MTEEFFLFLLKNQPKWAVDFKQQEEERSNIRRILSRKFITKQGKSREWIREELIKSLKIGELELIENLSKKGFDQIDFLI